MAGVEIPKLGSVKDRVLRDYLLTKSRKEVAKTKILALAAMSMANMGKDPQKIGNVIVSTFSDYLNMELYLESTVEQVEIDMKEEYEFWKKVRPKINIGKGDKKGATLSVSSLKPVKDL